MLAANLVTVLMFHVSSRYRFPSLPPLIAFAAATVVGVADLWGRGRRTDAGAIVVAIGVLFILAHSEKDASAAFQEAHVHYNAGNLWSERHEPDRALTEYRRAITMDDTRSQVWFNMGNTLRDLKRDAAAAEAYGEAARRRPRSSKTQVRTGEMPLATPTRPRLLAR